MYEDGILPKGSAFETLYGVRIMYDPVNKRLNARCPHRGVPLLYQGCAEHGVDLKGRFDFLYSDAKAQPAVPTN
jgi:hypothetical protein